MAWTAPRTYVDGEILTADILNIDIRDNLNALSLHAHGGSAGDGDDELSGVDKITFDDIADPAAPGASKTVLWTNSGKAHQRAGASGAAEELSTTDHSHNERQSDETALANQSAGGSSISKTAYDNTAPTNTINMTTTAGNHMIVNGFNTFLNDTGASDTVSAEIDVDGTQKLEGTVNPGASGDDIGIVKLLWTGSVSAAAHNFRNRQKVANAANTYSVMTALTVVEMGV